MKLRHFFFLVLLALTGCQHRRVWYRTQPMPGETRHAIECAVAEMKQASDPIVFSPTE